MSKIPNELSVIIPAYNEQENILPTIQSSLATLRRLFPRFEIIIIDDKSTDRTGQLADELASANPEVRVIHNVQNQGQGGSQIIGFSAARYELVTHNGMDAPFDLEDLPKMLPLFADADIVVAARTSRPGYTTFRRIVSWVNRMMMRTMFSLKLDDYNFIQIYRKSVLKNMTVNSRSAGFVVPEILLRAHKRGARVKQIPIEYHKRQAGVATVNSKVVFRSLKELLKFWWSNPS